MRTRIAGALLACAAFAAATAPAQAQFAPVLEIGVEPPTAGSSPALTAAITQPAFAGPIERFTLSLPPGFSATGAPGAASCPLASIRARNCTAASAIGTADGLGAGGVALTGTIHKVSPGRFVVLASALGGAVRQTVVGSLGARPGGSLDLTVDDLPSLTLATLNLRFAGGDRALVQNPAACGTYAIDGKFTSRAQDLALARSLIAVTGCAGVPAISVTNLRMSRERFRVGRQTIIAWSASRAASHTDVRVERKVKGRWRVVGVLVAGAKQGENVLRWGGLLGEKALKPGRYALRIQPAGSAPAKPPLEFEILGR